MNFCKKLEGVLNNPFLLVLTPSFPPPSPLPQGHASRTVNCGALHKRAEKIQAYIEKAYNDKHLKRGDHIALMFPCGVELVATFFACLYAGEYGLPTRFGGWG